MRAKAAVTTRSKGRVDLSVRGRRKRSGRKISSAVRRLGTGDYKSGGNVRNKNIPPGAASARSSLLERAAFKAGSAAAADRDGTRDAVSPDHLQQSYRSWYEAHAPHDLAYPEMLALSLAFRRGYALAAGGLSDFIPLPLKGSASAVILASNEEQTLPAVLGELRRLPLLEIIVVLNGCSDGSFAAIKRDTRTTILSFPERLGHDVGRSLGAAAASGDILLFTDGDIVLPAKELAAFLIAADRGTDVVLNDITPYLPLFSKQDAVTRCKTFLNLSLGRPDLKANSLTAVPHAISRRAIASLGTKALMVPPKAQALALARGLTVSAPYSVDVIRSNRVRSGNNGTGNSVARLIIGDHMEALGEVMRSEGVRLNFRTLPRSLLAKVRNAH